MHLETVHSKLEFLFSLTSFLKVESSSCYEHYIFFPGSGVDEADNLLCRPRGSLVAWRPGTVYG
jgi:hypothetical protein